VRPEIQMPFDCCGLSGNNFLAVGPIRLLADDFVAELLVISV
jgi:hypothetical protein